MLGKLIAKCTLGSFELKVLNLSLVLLVSEWVFDWVDKLFYLLD
jgi:uncharacterized membrane protein